MSTNRPTHFAGQQISYRLPYIQHAELLVANGTTGNVFPDGALLHNIDKPFEIHRCIMRLTPFDNQAVPVIVPPQFIAAVPNLQQILESFFRVRLADTGKNENLTKNATLVSGFSKKLEQVWEFDDVYTMVRSEGFTVQVDSLLANFTITVGNVTTTVANVRFEIDFEGELLVIAPPSEQR